MLPLDNIKTHCQAGSRFKMRTIMKNIYEMGGLSNFYSGSSILAMGCIPAHAIYFSIYEKAKELLECDQQNNGYRFALVGILSSLFHDSIMTPTEVVKQRLQLHRTESSNWISTRQLITNMYRNEGILSFYRSFGVNYLMNVPFGSIIILMNQKLKKIFKVSQSSNHFSYYVCGGIAGALAAIPTTPFDVIKTKLNTQACLRNECEKRPVCEKMSQKFDKKSSSSANFGHKSAFQRNPKVILNSNNPVQTIITMKTPVIKYHNIIDTTQTIFKEQGLLGFFVGMRMRMAIQSFSSAIAWGTYQAVTSAVNSQNNKFKE